MSYTIRTRYVTLCIYLHLSDDIDLTNRVHVYTCQMRTVCGWHLVPRTHTSLTDLLIFLLPSCRRDRKSGREGVRDQLCSGRFGLSRKTEIILITEVSIIRGGSCQHIKNLRTRVLSWGGPQTTKRYGNYLWHLVSRGRVSLR